MYTSQCIQRSVQHDLGVQGLSSNILMLGSAPPCVGARNVHSECLDVYEAKQDVFWERKFCLCIWSFIFRVDM